MGTEQLGIPFGTPVSAGDPPRVCLPRPSHLATVCGISSGMSARHFFGTLEAERVTMLVDTRQTTTYRDARFAHGDDLVYACERYDVGYAHIAELAPTADLRAAYYRVADGKSASRDERAVAWTAFLKGYVRLVATERKVLRDGSPLRDLLYGPHSRIAFLCACHHHEDCHRRVLLGMIARHVAGVGVSHLSPEGVGGIAPSLKSPRRYLLEAIPVANVPASHMPGRRAP